LIVAAPHIENAQSIALDIGSLIPHPQVWLSIVVVVSILLMLVRAWSVAEVCWITGGVILLLALRLESPANALGAAASGPDVYLFLAGMMLLSELASKHGVFDWLAAAAVRHRHCWHHC
jgi:arsenical pump membrane protein